MQSPPPERSFASDNAAGVHPDVMAAIQAANVGHALAYGSDAWTARTIDRFRELFGRDVDVLLTFGGTGANIVGLQCLLAPWQAVICPASSHINTDECGSPERFTGSKLVDVPTTDGKLRPEHVTDHLYGLRDEHHVQPHVVSITQSTENGTLYSAAEIAALADVAHANGLLVHLDGARIGNAIAALGGDVRSCTVDAGVDVLSFGGTKAGAMYGEAVVFLTPGLADGARFVRKQAAQLPSKMRYVAAQFEALLTDDLWIRNGRRANEMARRLAGRVATVDGVKLSRQPEVNSVFASLPRPAIDVLQAWSFFWDWDVAADEVRWMTSYDTTVEDIDRFVAGLREVMETTPCSSSG